MGTSRTFFFNDYLVLCRVLHVSASSHAVVRDGHKNMCDKVNTRVYTARCWLVNWGDVSLTTVCVGLLLLAGSVMK